MENSPPTNQEMQQEMTFVLLTVYSSPLVRVNSQRWLLSTLTLRILLRLTRTLRWTR